MSEHDAPQTWSTDLVEVYRLQDPAFCQFLEDTGRINQYLHTKTTEA